MKLFFHNLQHFHGARLNADPAGDALGNGIFRLMYHNLHGTNLNTFSAADAVFLIDHINAGLGVLGNGLMLTSFHALTALDTGLRLGTASLGDDLNGGIVGVEFLIKGLGAGANALQASHAFHIFLNSESLHNETTLLYVLFILDIINGFSKNSNPNSGKFPW